MSFIFSCPFCNLTFECKDDWENISITCPSCKNNITITQQNSNFPVQQHRPKQIPTEKNERKKERCPYCDELVSIYATICPHCQEIIIKCPQCGFRGQMDYVTSAKDALNAAKATGGAIAGAFCGGLVFGPIGAIIAGIGGFAAGAGKDGPQGYLKCKRCGYIIK